MIGFLPALRVQEFCKVVGVLVGIVEGIGLLIMPCGYGMSILLILGLKVKCKLDTSLCPVYCLAVQCNDTILSLGQLLVAQIPKMRCDCPVEHS